MKPNNKLVHSMKLYVHMDIPFDISEKLDKDIEKIAKILSKYNFSVVYTNLDDVSPQQLNLTYHI